jgi:hypothetical protein
MRAKANEAEAVRKKPIRVERLDTVGRVITEMGKLYREARRGEIDSGDAARLARILQLLRQGLETADLERRIEAIERSMNGGKSA